MPLYPYTNSQELNLDWILQVVKDFQTKYTNFDQALADALESIEAAKDGCLADMQEALTSALDAINEAIGGIDDAKDAALLALQTALTEATAVIESLYNTLPASAQQILGQISILDNIITGNGPDAFTWLQGGYTYESGQTAPTPPEINTESAAYTVTVSTRYLVGAAGRRLRIITDNTVIIEGVYVWYNTPPGGGPGILGASSGQYVDVLIPLNATAISITAKHPTESTITPEDVAGHVEIQWITDFVNQAVIAPKEGSLTADVARNAGEYFFWEGVLYKATANIAIGDTIVLSGAGANCEEAQIGADLADKITAPTAPTTGQFLQWSGSAWVAADLPVYQGGVDNG